MDGVLQLIGSKSKLQHGRPITKLETLSPKTSAQGYHCNCGRTEFVLLLSVSSVTVNTFHCFLSSSVPLPSKSLSPAISNVHSRTHTLHTFHHFYFTLAFSHSTISLCLIHYFACPFLSTSFCPPSVSLSHITISVIRPLPSCPISFFCLALQYSLS